MSSRVLAAVAIACGFLALVPRAVAQDDVLHIVGDQVGIGTATPAAPLHIEADRLAIRWVNQGGQTWEFTANTTTGRLNFKDVTNGETILKIEPAAVSNLLRVGVLASDTVDINGNLVVTGTITPDYVFLPSYELMRLDELEQFVSEYQHLPRVPSADEISESGVNVVDLQMRLLEKIEELVLYTFEQERTLMEQHEVIEQLKTRLGQLETDQPSLSLSHR